LHEKAGVPARRGPVLAGRLFRVLMSTDGGREELPDHHEKGTLVMDEQTFQTKLAELMNELSTLPPSERRKLQDLANATQQRHKRLRQTISELHESLDYVRMSLKYLLFDLEATRRENDYLRQMLEEDRSDSYGDGDFESP
jgi:chromosome segregation ATPase